MDKNFTPRSTLGAQPSNLSVLARKEDIWRVNITIGRFFYDACIPRNAMYFFYFKPILDDMLAISLGCKGPTYHQFWINLLKDVKKEVQLLVNSCHEILTKVGCIIMSDG